ncbi:MAG: hypothetical protein JW990_20745 [Thermoleophilia bacterium]|nr:hypothetical protein [Thermoleophilia bacterium]
MSKEGEAVLDKLEKSPYRKYFKVGDEIKIPSHPHEHEVPDPAIFQVGTEVPAGPGFRIATFAITEPFEMVSHTHTHDFDQYLSFYGCPPHMLELGGEVEFTIGEEGKELETFIFTKPFMVHVAPGVRHCPLRYTKIDDPAKPMIHQDLVFTGEYVRKPAE